MMLRKNQQPIKIGGLTITIIGPTDAHLRNCGTSGSVSAECERKNSSRDSRRGAPH
jgi:hypothetical protein